MTLMEVLLALVIFMLSFIAISSLLNRSADNARDIEKESEAARLADSKMAEVVAGAESIDGGEGTFPEAPEWNWSVTTEPHESVTGLYRVTVRVFQTRPDGTEFSETLTRLTVDPLNRTQPLPPAEEEETLDIPQ